MCCLKCPCADYCLEELTVLRSDSHNALNYGETDFLSVERKLDLCCGNTVKRLFEGIQKKGQVKSKLFVKSVKKTHNTENYTNKKKKKKKKT